MPHIKGCEEVFPGEGNTHLRLAGNSLDVNPIENLWSIIKQRLREKDYTMKQKLMEAIIELWNRDKKSPKIAKTW